MLQACLNGDRHRSFHAAIPCAPEELAKDAARAVAAGAAELHVHPRGADDLQSLAPGDVAACLAAIRGSLPGIPVGISTLWSIPPTGRERQNHIRQWTTLPDYVSVNLIEDDAPEVIRLVQSMGVGVEAGIWSVTDAERFLTLPEAGKSLRILVEINEQDAGEGMTVADGIIRVLGEANLKCPILLHGCDATMWPIYHETLARGLDGRIGLEDGAHLPSGALARDNADLLAAAVRMSKKPL
ncbi:MAG: 3-keto-5-aminohexanoate cleavage protein [Phyllobacterium sp.]